jgi:drug/metabolite transporter (DMT)-like permease
VAWLLAIATAVFFAAGSVTAKRGLQAMNMMAGLLVSLVMTTMVTLVAVLADPPSSWPVRAIIFFAASGLLGDGVGRIAFLGGVHRLGPSTAVPIQTAIYPALAVVLGIVLLSESVPASRLLGVGAVVVGVWTLTSGSEPDYEQSSAIRRTSELRQHRVAFSLPAVAGVAFGSADVLRKEGLDYLPSPALGATVAALAALTAWACLVGAAAPLRRQVHMGDGAGWFAVSGVLQGLGLLALFGALDAGNVSSVAPIVASQPLVVVVFSAFLLKEVEALSWSIIVGSFLTMVGVIVVVLA